MIDEILKKITPTEIERRNMARICSELIKLLTKEFKKKKQDVKVQIFGSVSRDTWLSYEKDIDVFVRFPKDASKKYMEGYVTNASRKILASLEKRFAEHPYVSGVFKGYNVEVVPYYGVEDATKLVSAVDRTPFHDSHVRSKLRGRQNEVRLLKQFTMGIGCYGAEAKVEGFSGYLCELLVMHYGSFEKVLKAASEWSVPEVIDSVYGSGPFDKSPLVFPDPVDNKRNVASALSTQNFMTFTYGARMFLKNPGMEFFFPAKRIVSKSSVIKMFKDRGTHILAINFQTPSIVEDILYPQLRKTLRRLENLLKNVGFNVMRSDFFVDKKTTIAFEMPYTQTPSAMIHRGPRVGTDNEENFLTKHKSSDKALSKPFISGKRWMVILKREHSDAEALISTFLSNNLRERGIPKYIAAEVERGFELLVDMDAINEDLLGFFANLFNPIFPWEVKHVRKP